MSFLYWKGQNWVHYSAYFLYLLEENNHFLHIPAIFLTQCAIRFHSWEEAGLTYVQFAAHWDTQALFSKPVPKLVSPHSSYCRSLVLIIHLARPCQHGLDKDAFTDRANIEVGYIHCLWETEMLRVNDSNNWPLAKASECFAEVCTPQLKGRKTAGYVVNALICRRAGQV